MTTSTDTDVVILPLPDVAGARGVVFPPASARGVSHALSMSDGAEMYRDTLGRLRAVERWRKYTLTLSASDISPPSLGGLWVGMSVRIHCACHLYTTGAPERPVVPGSQTTEDLDGGGTVTLYRPVLDMLVTGWTTSFQEWDAASPWEIRFEEI